MGSAVTLCGPRALRFLAGLPLKDQIWVVVHGVVANIGDWLGRFWSYSRDFLNAQFLTRRGVRHSAKQKAVV
jgi:hypothetical protein